MAITPLLLPCSNGVLCASKNARIPSPHDVFKSRIQMSSQKGACTAANDPLDWSKRGSLQTVIKGEFLSRPWRKQLNIMNHVMYHSLWTWKYPRNPSPIYKLQLHVNLRKNLKNEMQDILQFNRPLNCMDHPVCAFCTLQIFSSSTRLIKAFVLLPQTSC